MGLNAEFFYDTYALAEYVGANPAFKKYFKDHEGVTTRLNLMELHYGLLRDSGEEKANLVYDSLLPLTIEFGDETIKKATKFKLERKSSNISYVDALGYQLALERKIKFLTGDKEFKGMPNVEFVK